MLEFVFRASNNTGPRADGSPRVALRTPATLCLWRPVRDRPSWSTADYLSGGRAVTPAWREDRQPSSSLGGMAPGCVFAHRVMPCGICDGELVGTTEEKPAFSSTGRTGQVE